MSKQMRRRTKSKKDKPSQKQRTQAQEKKSLNKYHYLMMNDERFISVDRLVSFENLLDDSWE